MNRMKKSIVLGFLLASFAVLPARADERVRTGAEIINDITIAQNLNAQIPLDLRFKDEAGRDVKLGDYFGDKPVILTLAYNRCSMLCTQVLNGMVKSLRVIKLEPGKDFKMVTVSIDPSETPAEAMEKKLSYVRFYNREGAANAWSFLTGEERAIRQLADVVGFRYVYDSVSRQYAHGSTMMVITPDGRVAAYQFGVEFSAKDLQLALVDASGGKIGSPVDMLMLLCYSYDPLTGKYGMTIRTSLQIGAAVTALGLGGFLVVMMRREKRKKVRDASLVRLRSGMNN